MEPGQTISIRATAAGSGRVSWSLGRPGSPSSNLQFDAEQYAVPISAFSAGGSLFTMITSPILGSATDFHASISLEYEETQAVYLTAVNDPALEITASFPTEVGPEAVMLGASPMPLNRIVGL